MVRTCCTNIRHHKGFVAMGVWASRPSDMFGGKISDHLDKDGINKFVRWSVEEIERKGQGLKTDALYRASGGHDEVQRIRGQPERGMPELLHHERNVHVLTGALKQFFRSLKQPILRIEEFQDVLKERENGNDCSDQLVQIINNVPKLQRPTLAYFFKHLYRVMHELENNMSLASLGVVFGPTLMRVASSGMRTEDVASLQSSIEDLNLVVELLLQHYAKVFDDDSVAALPVTVIEEATGGFVRCDLNVEDKSENLQESRGDNTNTSSYVGDAKEDHSNTDHEAKELGPEVANTSDYQQLVFDSADTIETGDFEVITTETPSLVSPTTTTPRTRNSKSTSSNVSGDFPEDFTSWTSPVEGSTRRSSSRLDDPMNSSSDADDIESVLAHMAKALSPEHSNNASDVERLSASSTTSRESCDVTVVEVLPDKALPSTDADTEPPAEELPENSSAYHLSSPRISIIEHSSSVGAVAEPHSSSSESGANQDVVKPKSPRKSTSSDPGPDLFTVKDKIRLFTKNEENVSSLKKQKSLPSGESEEDKKVKSEFEETFEKVTQQKK